MPEATVSQVAAVGIAFVAVCAALAVMARRWVILRASAAGAERTRAREDIEAALEELTASRLGLLRHNRAAETAEAEMRGHRALADAAELRIARLKQYLSAESAAWSKDALSPPAVPTAPMPESFAAALGEVSAVSLPTGEKP